MFSILDSAHEVEFHPLSDRFLKCQSYLNHSFSIERQFLRGTNFPPKANVAISVPCSRDAEGSANHRRPRRIQPCGTHSAGRLTSDASRRAYRGAKPGRLDGYLLGGRNQGNTGEIAAAPLPQVNAHATANAPAATATQMSHAGGFFFFSPPLAAGFGA